MSRAAAKALGAIAIMATAGTVHAGDIVSDWNSQLLDSIAATNTAPPRASRMMAMMKVAAYEAVNSFNRNSLPS